MTISILSSSLFANPFAYNLTDNAKTDSYSSNIFSTGLNYSLSNPITLDYPTYTETPIFSLPFSLPSFSSVKSSVCSILDSLPFGNSGKTTSSSFYDNVTSILNANPFNPTKKVTSTTNFFSSSSTSIRLGSNLGKNIASIASSYLGYNEKNGSYKKFTSGRTEAWCADFATYVTKEAFRRSGKSLPTGFGSSSVEGLRSWGLANNCYLKTSGKQNKTSLIKNNVKSGDIIIFKENGASHTGIVDYIAADGTIHTIEGNTSDQVAKRSYSPNNATISGFVQMA